MEYAHALMPGMSEQLKTVHSPFQFSTQHGAPWTQFVLFRTMNWWVESYLNSWLLLFWAHSVALTGFSLSAPALSRHSATGTGAIVASRSEIRPYADCDTTSAASQLQVSEIVASRIVDETGLARVSPAWL